MSKKNKCLMVVLGGVVLAIVAILPSLFMELGDVADRLFNLVFSLGFGLIGGGLGSLYNVKKIEKIPGKSKQMEIEYNDERNEFIRVKANAKAGDISNWCVMLVAYICIVMGLPTWLVLLLLGVFSLKTILWIVLMNKYNKEF